MTTQEGELHLSKQGLLKLVAADLQDDELRRVLFHALASCPGCRAVMEPVVEFLAKGDLEIDFGLLDLSLAESRSEAENLFHELTALERRERRRALQRERFRSWGLCEYLCRASTKQGQEDAVAGWELAQLAVDLANRLGEDEPCERAWLYELRGLAGAYLADALRRNGESASARKALEKAAKQWEQGWEEVGDVLGYEEEYRDLETRNNEAR